MKVVLKLIKSNLKKIFTEVNKFRFSYYENSYISNYLNNDDSLNKDRKTLKSVDYDKIFKLLENLDLEPKLTDDSIKLKICPLCTKPHNDDITNFNTCSISKTKNVFNCFRCGNKGHIFQFLKKMKNLNKNSGNSQDFSNIGLSSSGSDYDNRLISNEDSNIVDNLRPKSFANTVNQILNEKKNEKSNPDNFFNNNENYSQYTNAISNLKTNNKSSLNNISFMYEMFKRCQGLNEQNNQIIIDYLINERKLNLKTAKLFKIGFSFEKFTINEGKYYNLPCISFPLFTPIKNVQILKPNKNEINEIVYEYFNCDNFYLTVCKVRAIGKELKKFQRIEPSGSLTQGLFGLELAKSILDNVKDEDKVIVITEGEYDAMAVFQETGLPAVSLPNGCSNLPNDLIPFLNTIKRIYLWTDADQPGKIAADNFSKKLGIHKTFIVNSRRNDPNGPKDANDCLIQGKDLNKYIKEAKLLAGDNIIKFKDIRSEILQFLSQYESFSGYKSSSFEFFNKKVQGLRNGEFTILTGETGCGKTTFLAQLSLDFLEIGVPTLWGSFEIKNDKLASMFLMQMAKKDLVSNK